MEGFRQRQDDAEEYGVATASTGVWMPHSVLSQPRQRPARGSSPGLTMLVQGAQPIER
jgi:hypothetical protein